MAQLLTVTNTYDSHGGTINAFSNSFQQTPKTTPEPTAVLSLIALGGLGLVSLKRKQS